MKMLLEKPYNVNKKEEKREILNYVSLLKYWSMILIIRMHIYEKKKRKIDYGARMSEFLFVSSGFLVC